MDHNSDFCNNCKESDCLAGSDDCQMIRVYLNAKTKKTAEPSTNPYYEYETYKQKYEGLRGQVVWAISHQRVVDQDGIVDMLRKTVKWLDEIKNIQSDET